MSKAGIVHHKKYVPTPVSHQNVHHSASSNENSYTISNTSVSPIMSESPPPRIEQKSTTTNKYRKSNLKSTSNTTKWSTTKKVIVGIVIAVIVIAVIATVIALAVVLSRKSDTTATTTSVTIAYWSLDSVTTDLYNVYNGTLVNSASYFTNTTNQPYVGNGGGLSLTSSSSQYFSVSSPFLDLTYKSFTIEAWIYPSISSSVDYGIFGQCQCSSCSNQCLYIIIRSYRLYVSFMSNDLSGNATLTSNTWYHIAFVYNNDTKQQRLFVNGYRDATKTDASPYQGTNGSIWIGASRVYLTTSYYNGYIDNFKITTRAKSSTEILNAATLTAYFSFDVSSGITYDSGPLGLNGTSVNTATLSGHLNEAMRFSGSSSYFYAYGFYQIGYGVSYAQPFSVSLWINPSSASACTIVQTAYTLSTYTCHNLLGFYSTLGLTAQIIVQGWAWPVIYGPFATLNTWTHISVTYSQTNGLRLYVNGVYYGTTGTFSFSNTNRIMYFQLGYVNICSSNYITSAGYQGLIDEVYVHSREISQSEVTTLASL
ncbi:unnamed protein product [Rotaria sordida]|uniref:Uncharacterized protein n=1 Tax=Rotaria sordida TaxID=392033 RepID=A0A815BEM0_9BILA|nr:unnamed protein product [Rotaria sordida]CAF1548733.1 unnamed protein product [Rotaria sordida]